MHKWTLPLVCLTFPSWLPEETPGLKLKSYKHSNTLGILAASVSSQEPQLLREEPSKLCNKKYWGLGSLNSQDCTGTGWTIGWDCAVRGQGCTFSLLFCDWIKSARHRYCFPQAARHNPDLFTCLATHINYIPVSWWYIIQHSGYWHHLVSLWVLNIKQCRRKVSKIFMQS